MTIVFRTSSFFFVFVITTKLLVFSHGISRNTPEIAAFVDKVEHLIDEGTKTRGELQEAGDRVEDIAQALRRMESRVIEWSARCVVRAGRQVCRVVGSQVSRLFSEALNQATRQGRIQPLGTYRGMIIAPNKCYTKPGDAWFRQIADPVCCARRSFDSPK